MLSCSLLNHHKRVYVRVPTDIMYLLCIFPSIKDNSALISLVVYPLCTCTYMFAGKLVFVNSIAKLSEGQSPSQIKINNLAIITEFIDDVLSWLMLIHVYKIC